MKVLCASIDLFVCEHLYLSLFNHLNLVLSRSTPTGTLFSAGTLSSGGAQR